MPRLALRVGLLLGTLLLGACQSGKASSISEELPSPLPPTPTPDQSAYWLAWQSSPHSDTYDLEKGPNTYCAKCHSPANWDQSATIDPPPNCVSCKFPSEAHPRVAAGNPLVPQEEWASIGCGVCHRMEDGIAESNYAWHDNVTGYYETVTTTSELCEKCHLDSETLSHKRELGNGAHADYSCTDCHDAHDTHASCAQCHTIRMERQLKTIPEHFEVTNNDDCDACHPGAFEAHTIQIQEANSDDCFSCHGSLMGQATPQLRQIGHSQVHAAVTCVACHDASGLEVGPDGDGGIWVTLRTAGTPAGSTTEPYQSHYLELSVSCARCHFPGNTWGIPEDVNGSIEVDQSVGG